MKLRVECLSKASGILWAKLLAGLVLASHLSCVHSKEVSSVSLFSRTVVQLDQSPPENSAVFANIALSQLATAYYDEVDIVYSHKATRKQTRWARSVTNYVHDIVLMNDSIVKGAQPSVRLYPHSEAVVQVGNRLITLAHPRVDEQSAFELSVLQEYCALIVCTSVTETATAVADWASSDAPLSQFDWKFSANGATCSHDKLTIQFDESANLKRLRSQCSELFNELEALIKALRWQRKHGVQIDWNFLAINAMQSREEHSVLLNGFGDTAALSLPRLAQAQSLLQDLAPWIQARLDGVAVIYEIRSQSYSW